jgi:hypothetical protein
MLEAAHRLEGCEVSAAVLWKCAELIGRCGSHAEPDRRTSRVALVIESNARYISAGGRGVHQCITGLDLNERHTVLDESGSLRIGSSQRRRAVHAVGGMARRLDAVEAWRAASCVCR